MKGYQVIKCFVRNQGIRISHIFRACLPVEVKYVVNFSITDLPGTQI